MKDSAFESFSESAQDALDFARCQRPDGSFYGTGGQCRKGIESGAKEKTATRTRPKAAIESDMKKLTSSGAMAAKGTAGVRAREAHAALKAELKKPLAGAKQKEAKAAESKASDKAKSSEAQAAGKEARKEMIAARNAEKAARAERKTREDRVKRLDTAVKRMATQSYSPAEVRQEKAELAAAKEKAATARRAHIDSKNEVKAATKRFRSGQETSGDNRRFGRDTERSKATDAQLKTALGDKRVSPTAKAAIERELSTRRFLGSTPSAKAQTASDKKADAADGPKPTGSQRAAAMKVLRQQENTLKNIEAENGSLTKPQQARLKLIKSSQREYDRG